MRLTLRLHSSAILGRSGGGGGVGGVAGSPPPAEGKALRTQGGPSSVEGWLQTGRARVGGGLPLSL